MRAPDTSTRIAQFVTSIRPQMEAHADAVLLQSLQGWLSYYRYLQVLRGGYSPPTVAYMQEHFFECATALLDHMADTFCHFFRLPWPCPEVLHTRLTRVFPEVCTAQHFQGDVAALHASMRDLQARIVTSGKGARLEEGAAVTPPEQLRELLDGLDQYIPAMLRFFAQNIERSILYSPLPSQWI